MQSPEQVMLDLPIAGPTSRMAAYGVDAAIIAALLTLLVLAIGIPLLLLQSVLESVSGRWLADVRDPQRAAETILQGFGWALSLLIIVQLAVEVLYFTLFETLAAGRTPGKMLVGLRVVTDSGRAVGLPQALARNLLRFIDALPSSYLVGLTAMLTSPRRKRLGDLAAGSIVVRLDRPPAAASIDASRRPGDEVFTFDHAQSSRIGALEVRLARDALRRADSAEERSTVRDRVLESAAEALRTRLAGGPVAAAQRAAFLRAVLRAAAKRDGGRADDVESGRR